MRLVRGNDMASFVLISALFVLGGCQRFNSSATLELLERFPTPIYSLTGEQLNGGPLGQPGCEDAQAAWLERVDLDQDGSVDLNELLNEAKIQFALMDLNHDGIITADELTQFRAKNATATKTEKSLEDHAPRPEERDRNGIHRMAVHPPGSQPDPVLSADANLDFKVTLDEFLILQKENMVQYAKNHHFLVAQDLNHLCQDRIKSATPSNR